MENNVLELILRIKDEATKQLSNFADTVTTNQKKINDLGKDLTSFGKKMDLFVTVPIIAAGTAAVKMAADFEQTQISFQTMLGSTEKANKLLKDLTDFATKTPFTLSGLETSTKQLLAYGITQEDVMKDLKTLGDIASGVGMDKLPNLILAFGQVKAATHLTGMELRQFTEAGVPLIDALATHLKTTSANIIEMVSAGEISFNDVRTALEGMTIEGGKFNDLMSKQMASTSGQFSNLQDQVTLLAREFGAELLPVAKDVLTRLQELIATFRGLSPEVKRTIIVIAGAIAVIAPIITVLGIMLQSFVAVVKAIAFLGKAFTVLKAAATAIAAVLGGISLTAVLIIAAIVALAAAAYLIYRNWGAISAFFVKLGSDIASIWNKSITAIKTTTINVFNSVKSAITTAINAVSTFVVGVFNAVKRAISNAINAVVNAFNVVIDFLGKVSSAVIKFFTPLYEVIRGIVAIIATVLLVIFAFFFNIFAQILAYVVGVFIAIGTAIATAMVAIWTVISNVFTEIAVFIAGIAVAIWTAVSTAFINIYNFVAGIVTQVWAFIVATFTTILNFLIGILLQIFGWFAAQWNAIYYGVIIPIVTAISDFIKTTWTAISGFVGGILTSIWGAVKNVWGGITGTIKTETESAFGWLEDRWNTLWTNVSGFADKILDKIKTMVTGITDALRGIKFPKVSVGEGSVSVGGREVKYPKLDVEWFQQGGFVSRTGLAMVHAGEFVLSRDMLAGRQPAPVNNQNSQTVNVFAEVNTPVDLNVLGYQLAYALRNTR